jgi:hypothetical protein
MTVVLEPAPAQVVSRDPDALYENWRLMLDAVVLDVRALSVRRSILVELDTELVEHQRTGTDVLCEQFLRPVYIEAQAATIGRLVDDRRGAMSLYALLTEMIANAEILTRKRYVNRYLAIAAGGRRADADALFDSLAGRGVARIARRDLELRRTMLLFDADRAIDVVRGEVAQQQRVVSSPLAWGTLNDAINDITEHFAHLGKILLGGPWTADGHVETAWHQALRPGLFSIDPRK